MQSSMEPLPEQTNSSLEKDSATRRPVRVLHLEDNVNDRDLISRALLRAGLRCEFFYAANEPEFYAGLRGRDIDLILSDFTLPGYGGVEALAYSQEHYPEVPYLFVSGTIGEERVVESLKNGAVDCVLKSNLSRLPGAVRSAMREVGERHRRHLAEQALRESEARFREMARTVRDVFWIARPDARRLIYVSPGYEQIWGRMVEELHARPELWLEAIHPDDRSLVETAFTALSAGQEVRIEYRISRPDGPIRWVENRAYPSRDNEGRMAHAVGVVADITDRRQLQEQLLQAQKMEALGRLAGGVAHDFNNLLTVINGYASHTLARRDLPEHVVHPLRQIYSAGERAANLTRRLLVFSRKEAMNLKPLDMNACIQETVTLLGRLIGEDIALSLLLAPGLPPVEADAGMIEQVLMNLAVNARDAMPAGGQVIIRTEPREIDASEARTQPARRAGRFVRLSVTDTGAGIPAEVLPRIFEPFFTTKKSGESTGLGLAMIFGIAEKHRGWVEVESRVAEGTTFHVFIPALPDAESECPPASGSASAPASGPAPSAGPAPGVDPAPISRPGGASGGETILLVEDEQAVREFARAVLQHHGYRVLQAASGKDALETWKWHGPRIRLLLTDLVLPDDLSGLELARRLRVEAPELKVILASGYSRDRIDRHSPLPGTIRFLQKPYQPRLLAEVVRETLDSS